MPGSRLRRRRAGRTGRTPRQVRGDHRKHRRRELGLPDVRGAARRVRQAAARVRLRPALDDAHDAARQDVPLRGARPHPSRSAHAALLPQPGDCRKEIRRVRPAARRTRARAHEAEVAPPRAASRRAAAVPEVRGHALPRRRLRRGGRLRHPSGRTGRAGVLVPDALHGQLGGRVPAAARGSAVLPRRRGDGGGLVQERLEADRCPRERQRRLPSDRAVPGAPEFPRARVQGREGRDAAARLPSRSRRAGA